jgi:hypothetical protein
MYVRPGLGHWKPVVDDGVRGYGWVQVGAGNISSGVDLHSQGHRMMKEEQKESRA